METQIKTVKAGKMKGTDVQKVTPFLWFDNQAEEAAKFYTSIFDNSGITTVTRYGEAGARASGRTKGSIMTVAFSLEGHDFAAINGGPVFQINPSISFFVSCDTPEEIDEIWDKLCKDGTVLMELAAYPFSEKFGWVKDKYGVTWQLMLGGTAQKVTTFLTFTGEQYGKAEEAIKFYVSLFRNSKVLHIDRYRTGEGGREGTVKNARFSLDDIEFMAIDAEGDHQFSFNPAVSLVVNCKDQEELDFYWGKLTEGGDERAQQCGWLQDKFGVSWQVIPAGWDKLLNESNPEKAERLMEAVLKMKKLDMNVLMNINQDFEDLNR